MLPRNRFTRAVESFAARHQRIKPYTPKHNGKVERYQQTLAREVLYAAAYDSEQQRRDRITTWLIHYNYHRPHSAADGHHQPHAWRPPSPTSCPVTPSSWVSGQKCRIAAVPFGECRGLRPRLRQAVICFCRCEGTF
ncbi:transposase [Dermacoccus barathri]|nr:transposase [Dermacoccus barathri]